MNTALKEWASVVAALDSGRQIMLLRKGGIVEARRGGFELRHREFLFFPTFEHQHADSLKPEFHRLATAPTGDSIPIHVLARVTDIIPAPQNIDDIRGAAAHHIWNDRFLDMRYGYRPDLPLYIILVRALRLSVPVDIPDRPSYAGCKSWVYITEEIETDGADPVMSDSDYAAERTALLSALGLDPRP